MNLKLLTFCGIFLCFFQFYTAQNNFFSEIKIQKRKQLKNDYRLEFTFDYKGQTNNEFKWQRPYFQVALNKILNNNWSINGGIKNQFTSQTNKDNLYELRPFVGPSLSVPIIKRIAFQQAAKWEVRNFFYTEDKSNNEVQNRFRYKMHLKILLNKDLNHVRPWSVNTGYEWFFVREPNSGEQYSNLREFSIEVTKVLNKNRSIHFNYYLDRVNEYQKPNASNNHSFTVSFGF